MLKIGSVQPDSPVLLAPMAGFTNLPFRMVCRKMGAGLTFTELTMSEGVARRIPQSMHYLESSPEEQPVVAHLYGAEPDALAEACAVVEETGRFCMIDLNGGCPVRKIQHKGAGVALMRHPDKVYDILSAMTNATSLPVTLKTRLGLSETIFTINEVAKAAEEAGASALHLHARLAANGHNGPASWEKLKEIKDQCKIPVLGNGGIAAADEAFQMMDETGVDGVLIGRAALGNPWIFRQIREKMAGLPVSFPSHAERIETISEHLMQLEKLVEIENHFRRRRRHTDEYAACRLFRGHLVKYMSGMRGVRDLLRKLETLITRDAMIEAAQTVLEQNPDPFVR